jgi:GNAT superfamily N-acetyltransferase
VADVSVRPARPLDASEIARIQLATWQLAYASILPAEVLTQLASPDGVAQAGATWGEAISAPPSRRHHVLVALEKESLVGFVAVAPDEDAAATVVIGPLLVEPRWGRRGHASRLLAAATDHAKGDAMTSAQTWIPEADEASKSFFTAAGWAPDGYARALDTGAGELREIRLHTSLDA